MTDNNLGDHETQVSEGGEADLHKHLIKCEKNPGHPMFIAVDSFTLNHLPEGYRDNDLCDYIKFIAGVTVRIAVELTSPQRPEFWPNTKCPYPCYDMRGKTTGSGMASGRVNKFIDGYNEHGDKHKEYITCCCKKCQHSSTASQVWWEFDVYTATHVVFDGIEAVHTSLRLFYDSKESPVFIVDQVSVGYVNTERDLCRLHCVTCDKDMGYKLSLLLEQLPKVKEKLWYKYLKSQDVDKLNFLVSHPHGCCKQISVGHWVDKYKVGKDSFYKFTYTTCTCPGSSGAPVFCLRYSDGWCWWYQLVHGGSLMSNINYSGASIV